MGVTTMTKRILLSVLLTAAVSAQAATTAAPAKKPVAAASAAAPTAAPVQSAVATQPVAVQPAAAPVPVVPAPASAIPAAVPEPTAPASAPATAVSAPVASESAAPAFQVALDDEDRPPRLSPFYNFGWTESLAMPSQGNFLFGANLGTTLGGRYVLNPEHTVLAAYELVYAGPGLRSTEGQEFTERTTDHSVSLGHLWGFMPGLKLNSRLTYLSEFRRSGGNEPWGEGLYDFRSIGLTEGLAMPLMKGLVGDLNLSLASVKFPNYTDLISEFQMGGTTAEKTGGFQDYNRITVKPSFKYRSQGLAWFSWSAQMFEHSKVITDGLVYGTAKQRENIYEIGASWRQAFFGKSRGFSTELSLEPAVRVNMKNSNQNFLRFKSLGTLPEFQGDYYSYNAYDFSLPIRWTLEDTTMLVFSPEVLKRDYRARAPRDGQGDYILGAKQWNQVVLLNFGVSWQAYQFARWAIGYTYQISRSNNKYDRYLPYNYFGNVVAASLNVTY
jgi:hypothetical protein